MCIFIPGDLYGNLFFLQMPVDGETCGDNHNTNLELLAHYHDHIAWLWFGGFCYIIVSTSGAYAALRLTISPNVEAVTRPHRCTIHSPDWSSP